jgi:hypothetical protein
MARTASVLVIVSALTIFGARGVIASSADRCNDPEAQMLRDLLVKEGPNGPHQAKLKGLPILEQGEAQCRARMGLSDEEAAKVAENKRTMYEQRLQELTAQEKTAPPSSELSGIFEGAPLPSEKWLFTPLNVWQGDIGTSEYTVEAGASYTNPMQGEVAIGLEPYYPTPTATGPVRIVSESGGILTLESIAGTYEVSTPDNDPGPMTSKQVTTPGGATYHFNIVTRKFQEANSPLRNPASSQAPRAAQGNPSARIVSQ